jgi:Meiotically up-regulated gene 113
VNTTIDSVYLVRIGKHVKIGFSTNVTKRLKTYQTASADIQLLLSIPGDRTLEKRLHGLLSATRIAREIFQHDWRVESFIAMVHRDGLDSGLKWLADTTPQRLSARKQEERTARHTEARRTRAEKDAYFATLVTERKQRIGW